MGVTVDEVYATLREPVLRYPGGDGHRAGRQVHVAGRIAVVTGGKWVVTVLWHRADGRYDITGPYMADV